MRQPNGNRIPQTTVRIPVEIKEKLKQIGELQNQNMSEAIIEALRFYLDWYK